MKYLLDTNILSEPLKAAPNKSVLAKLELHGHEAATSTLVWHELLFGCYRLSKSKKRALIERYLMEVIYPNVPILSYDERAAKWHALERSRLSLKGETPPFVDGQIAATAVTKNLILVTGNPTHFKFFNDLTLETWRK